jgi:hypothetical protein
MAMYDQVLTQRPVHTTCQTEHYRHLEIRHGNKIHSVATPYRKLHFPRRTRIQDQYTKGLKGGLISLWLYKENNKVWD